MHGIDHVFHHIAVVAGPLGVTNERGPFRRAELLRQAQGRRCFELWVNRIEQENGAVRFGGVEGARLTRAFQLAARATGHACHRAIAAHFDAVIRAGDAVTQDDTQRQGRTSVWAVIFQRVNLACLVSPQHNFVTQAAQRDGAFFDECAGTHGVPEVFETFGQHGFGGVRLKMHDRGVHG